MFIARITFVDVWHADECNPGSRVPEHVLAVVMTQELEDCNLCCARQLRGCGLLMISEDNVLLEDRPTVQPFEQAVRSGRVGE